MAKLSDLIPKNQEEKLTNHAKKLPDYALNKILDKGFELLKASDLKGMIYFSENKKYHNFRYNDIHYIVIVVNSEPWVKERSSGKTCPVSTFIKDQKVL